MSFLGKAKSKVAGKEGTFNFFGFAVFDLFHIVFGIASIVLLYVQTPNDFELLAACHWTELALSLLLISFIGKMVDRNDKAASSRPYYVYAWLTASMAAFLPSLFMLPLFLEERESLSFGFSLAELILSGAAFTLIFISMHLEKKAKAWTIAMALGAICFLATLPCAILETSFSLSSNVDKALEIAKDVAIVFPPLFFFLSFFSNHKKESPSGEGQ